MQIIYLLLVIVIVSFIVFLQWIIARRNNTDNSDQKRIFFKSNQLHLTRRFQHIATGLAITILTFILPYDLQLYSSFSGFFFLFLVTIIRKKFTKFNEIYIKNFGSILRPHELQSAPAALYFLLGVYLVMLLFDQDITRLCILFVTLADPIASIVGITIKSPQIFKGKSLAGSLAAGITCNIVGGLYFLMFIMENKQENCSNLFEFMIISGIIGLISEILPAPRKLYLDDNLMIQLYAGIQFKFYYYIKELSCNHKQYFGISQRFILLLFVYTIILNFDFIIWYNSLKKSEKICI